MERNLESRIKWRHRKQDGRGKKNRMKPQRSSMWSSWVEGRKYGEIGVSKKWGLKGPMQYQALSMRSDLQQADHCKIKWYLETKNPDGKNSISCGHLNSKTEHRR